MTKLDLKGSVLLTIAYSSIFSFPLTFEEIKLRLLFFSPSNNELMIVLKKLVKSRQIEYRDGFFYVGSRSFLSLRQERLINSQKKLLEAKWLVFLLQKLPFLNGLVVSGSAAVNNAKEKDDLDWLVISSRSSLWLVRPVLLGLAIIFGKKRERSGHHRDNSWCFNMFLTDSSLALPLEKRSIYTAYEICQAKFVIGRPGLEWQFLYENNWVKKYLPNFYANRLGELAENDGDSKEEKANYLDRFVAFFNQVSFMIQYQYMKKHITREIVELDRAFFHPRDTKKSIYKKWLSLVNLHYVKTRN